MPKKQYNTPHRSYVVKTRMTEEEYADFTERLKLYEMSGAEFIRQAITGAPIKPIIKVSPVNDELLAAIGKLIAEYGKPQSDCSLPQRMAQPIQTACDRDSCFCFRARRTQI